MPRLPNTLILKAHRISPLLPLILRGTRDLDLAINELHWLREHVSKTAKPPCPGQQRKELLKLCLRRSRSEPLQYILGSQPFGPLDLQCRRGVLIPRPETEAYVTHTADLLIKGNLHQKLTFQYSDEAVHQRRLDGRKPLTLRILDLCTGTGCISLLLHALLSKKFHHLKINGVDISPTALALASKNLQHNTEKGFLHASAVNWGGPKPQVQFLQQDILRPMNPELGLGYDIIISNPPYISPQKFNFETARSVRLYEPTLALVPPVIKHPPPGFPPQEDIFYHRIIQLHEQYASKFTLMEVGDAEQAVRVVEMALKTAKLAKWNHVQLWRDEPGEESEKGKVRTIKIGEHLVHIKGRGKVRAVVIMRSMEWKPPRVKWTKEERERNAAGRIHRKGGGRTQSSGNDNAAFERPARDWIAKRGKSSTAQDLREWRAKR